eukprot:8793639-Pyramimonas_sp.AAC.1
MAFMQPGWSRVMLVRWRLARVALKLGLNVTIVDVDVALLKDPTPVFQEYVDNVYNPAAIRARAEQLQWQKQQQEQERAYAAAEAASAG